MRTLITGYVGYHNLGDEAILEGSLALLRRSGLTDVTVASGDPAATAAAYGVAAVRLGDLAVLDRAIAEADLVLWGGGSLIHDFWGFEPRELYDGAGHAPAVFLRIPLLARLHAVPCLAWAQGFSRPHQRSTEAALGQALRACRAAFVRDTASAVEVRRLGFDGAVVEMPDAAFVLPAHAGAPAGPTPVVGVCIRPWTVDSEGWEARVSAGLTALARAHRVAFRLVALQHEEGFAATDDLAAAEALRTTLAGSGISADVLYPRTPAEAIAHLAGCDVVLAMRYHAAVFAALAGVPVVPLAYDDKVRALAAELAPTGWHLDLDTFQPADLTRLLSDALERPGAAREQIAAYLTRSKARLTEVQQLLARLPAWINAPGSLTPDTPELPRGVPEASADRLAELEAHLDRMQRRFDATVSRLREREHAAVVAGEQLRTDQALRRQVEAQLAEAQDDLRATEAARGELETRLADARAELRTDQELRRHVEAQLAEARDDLRAAEAARVELETRLADARAELRGVSPRHAGEAAALRAEIQRLFQSRSWRITRPMRVLARLWRGEWDTVAGRWRLWVRMRYRRAGQRHPRLARAARSWTRPGYTPPVPAPSPAVRPPPPGTWGSVPVLPAVDAAGAESMLGRAAAGAERRRYDVICFSIIDWEFRYQRPQQVMSQFAAHGHRVFYVSTSRFQPVGSGPVVRQIKDNVFGVELAAAQPPNLYGEPVGGPAARALLDSLDDLRRTHDISGAVGYVMIASWKDVALAARDRWRWPVIYDCMDEWDTFHGIEPAVVRAESALVDACDLLVVSAARLYEKWKPAGKPMVLARNAVDFDFYAARCAPNDLLAGMPRPIAGYFGAIADWFDLDLMTAVARARPQYQFVLLGGVFGVDVSGLKALPNVAVLGQQPYETMPKYLYNFDVCLIPFKINPVTQATDPVKLYEYLSAGKPVVSVSLPELESCREHLYLASGAQQFVAQLDRAVAERDPAAVERRRRFAGQNTWAARYAAITDHLARTAPPVSVIVVTHDNLLLTRLCLESVIRNTEYPNYEVLVVDNRSTDGTPEFLQSLADRHPEIRVILNAENAGFARANNQALAVSRGAHLVLLNNDTIVPPGWLPRLLAHLADPTVGLVGPVTNFAGNEAKIEAPYATIADMERFAADLARRYEGQHADIPMLAMFCVAMRRDTYERIGPLDERFGVGMFEDDDYTRRARAAGLSVVCARDVFVHHVGQAAFRKLIDRGDYDALFERNRRSYEEKWGVTWAPHRQGELRWGGRRVP